MKFIIPKKELVVKTNIDDPVRFYYFPVKFIRDIHLSRVTSTLSLLTEKRYRKILEIGVGSGFTLPYLSTIANKIYATDIVELPSKLKKLLEYYDIEKRVSLFKCDVEEMGIFKDKTFDAIVGISVLEHLNNLKEGIKEIARVLKKDGELVFGFPTKSPLNSLGFWFSGLFGDYRPGTHKQTAEKIIPMLKQYFVVEKIIYIPTFFPQGMALYNAVRCRLKK